MAEAARKGLFDKRKIALARARFHAWWEGEDFNEEAALAAIEAAANVEPPAVAGPDELFDALPFDMPPRLTALMALWGDGRVRPGASASEKAELALLGIAPEGALAVLGPGLEAPVLAIAADHPGKIEVFEWRDETFEALQHRVRQAKLDERVGMARIDLEAPNFPASFYDGMISIDDFTYSGHPPHLALQVVKCLKPGAGVVIECYVGLPSAELATAFASAFGEPQIRAHGDLLTAFTEAGLVLEIDEDLTSDMLDMARHGFKQLSEALAGAKLEVAAAQELAWEAGAWRTRMRLMAQKRLERRRFVLRRPIGEAAE